MNDIDIDVNVTAWKIGPVIIMRGTTPRHHSRNAPNSSNPGTRRQNPPASATIDRKVKKIVEIKPPPANPPRRERRRGK